MQKHPRAPSIRRMLDERVTVAVLDFLRDTRTGCMVSLAPPAEEEGECEDSEGEEGGSRPTLECFSFLRLSSVFHGDFYSFWRIYLQNKCLLFVTVPTLPSVSV